MQSNQAEPIFATNKHLWLCYVMVLTAHIALVWSLRYFPTQDGPSHLYNLAILQDLLNGGKDWGNYFYHDLKALPNLGYHIVAYPLLKLFPPLVTEKLFVSLNIILFAIAAPVLLRTFERPLFPASFLVFPAVFSFTLMMGFYSFTIATPLFLLATAVAWKIRNRTFTYQLVILNLVGFTLYFFHLIPFVFYLISIIIIPLAESDVIKDKFKHLILQMLLVSPLIIALLLYISQGKQTTTGNLSYILSFERNLGLIVDLLTFSCITFSTFQLIPTLLVLVIVVRGLTHFVKYHYRSLKCESSDNYLILLVVIMVSMFFVMPFRFGDGSYFNQRFPLVIYLLILPLLRFPVAVSWRKGLFPLVVISVFVSLATNTFVLNDESRKIVTFMSSQSFKLPAGSYLSSYKKYPNGNQRIDSLVHATSYYALFHKCIDVSNYEAYYDLFPVHFRNDAAAIPSADEVTYQPYNIDWNKYPAINYVIAWEMNIQDRINLLHNFKVILEAPKLTIWQNKTLCRPVIGS